jgi:hypothetical protein
VREIHKGTLPKVGDPIRLYGWISEQDFKNHKFSSGGGFIIEFESERKLVWGSYNSQNGFCGGPMVSESGHLVGFHNRKNWDKDINAFIPLDANLIKSVGQSPKDF